MARRLIGFTLIELLVVMAIIGTILSIAVPRYQSSVSRAKVVTLRKNLNALRDAIDKYYGDKGAFPVSLDDLVTAKYLRNIPTDPITERNDTWVTISPSDAKLGGVADVSSGAQGSAPDGESYASL